MNEIKSVNKEIKKNKKDDSDEGKGGSSSLGTAGDSTPSDKPSEGEPKSNFRLFLETTLMTFYIQFSEFVNLLIDSLNSFY
jgi:hypothetical protein